MTPAILYALGAFASFGICIWSRWCDDAEMPTWQIALCSLVWPALWLLFVAYWVSPGVRRRLR